jgi:ABC-type multidrug transport system fused ATPase/permease subunit
MSFKGNILLYDLPDEGLSALEALDFLGVRDALLDNKPEGLETIVPGVNQEGTPVSGGQRQMISLARVFASKPWLLVLDEPWAFLGTETQRLVDKAIFSLQPRPTIIIATHDLEQVTKCDLVMILERGKIAEIGNPAELLEKRSSKYRALVRALREKAAK